MLLFHLMISSVRSSFQQPLEHKFHNFRQQMGLLLYLWGRVLEPQERAERGQLTKSDVKFAFREGRKMLPPLRGYEVGVDEGLVFSWLTWRFFPKFCSKLDGIGTQGGLGILTEILGKDFWNRSLSTVCRCHRDLSSTSGDAKEVP